MLCEYQVPSSVQMSMTVTDRLVIAKSSLYWLSAVSNTFGTRCSGESQKLAATSKPDMQDVTQVFSGLTRTCDTVCSQDKYTRCKNNLPLHRDVIMISVIIEDWIRAPLSSFLSLSWEDVNGSFHRISGSLYFFLLLKHATKRDRLWCCSASQLPWESKPSCLLGEENVEMKKKKKKEKKKKAPLIIQSCGGDSWQAAAERALTPTNFNLERAQKNIRTNARRPFSFSQQLLQFFSESREDRCIEANIHTHSQQRAGTKRGEEEEGREREGRDIERLRESWCHSFGYVAPGWVFFRVCVHSDQRRERAALSA